MSVIILPETTKHPISLIGERAGICWGADTTDKAKNYKRGLDCINANHGRTLEYVNVEMVLDGYSARVIREWYTHIGGAPSRLQASTRYIDYSDFAYVTPPSIAKNEDAELLYECAMDNIASLAKQIEKLGIPREDIAMLLPLGMTTKIVDKRNLRNLIDMSRQRMCTRAYWEYRQLFKDICDALREYSEEWAYIIGTQMMPKCEALGYCPEKHSCGRNHIKADDKVGQTVYEIDYDFESESLEVVQSSVCGFEVSTTYNFHHLEDCHETLYLSREDAEKALANVTDTNVGNKGVE